MNKTEEEGVWAIIGGKAYRDLRRSRNLCYFVEPGAPPMWSGPLAVRGDSPERYQEVTLAEAAKIGYFGSRPRGGPSTDAMLDFAAGRGLKVRLTYFPYEKTWRVSIGSEACQKSPLKEAALAAALIAWSETQGGKL